jgi:ATP-dependent helicase HrpA
VAGVRRLAELAMERDLGKLWKELAGLARHLPAPGKQTGNFHDALHQMSAKLSTPAAAFITADILQKTAHEHLLAHALTLAPAFPLTAARFHALTGSAHRDLPALTHRLGDWVRQLLALRQAVLAGPKRYAGLEQDVARLMPADFLARTPHTRLAHLHRYLRAIQVRAERASLNAAKDTEKALQLTPFRDWETRVPAENREAFRWLLEEFRVSLFAQELGTAQPVSAQRLRTLGGI